MQNALTHPDIPNSGHGHVYPRPDKARARCGGVRMCEQCRGDAARKAAESHPTGPAIAVPDGWAGTDAEAIGLAVAGAVQAVTNQRDQLRTVLADLLDMWPESSWATESRTVEKARELLEAFGGRPPEAKAEGATMDERPRS